MEGAFGRSESGCERKAVRGVVQMVRIRVMGRNRLGMSVKEKQAEERLRL